MKKKKMINKLKTRYLIIITISLVILFLFFLLIKNIFSVGNYYKELSHVSDVKKSVKNNDNENMKTIGWIDIYNSKLNMPVFSVGNNFDGGVRIKNFAWTNSLELNNFTTIIGHNISNLGIPKKEPKNYFYRFEELMTYIYQDYAQQHKYFQFTYNNKEYMYKIFSVAIIDAYEVYKFPSMGANEYEMEYFINLFKDNSLFDYDVKVNKNDDIMVLTTCTRLKENNDAYSDIVVVGKKINDKFIIDNSKVKKTENYKKIDKVLRGEGNVS